MSKLSNLFRLFIMLQRKKLITCKEISEKLEVTERQVRSYIDDLVIANIPVESIPGRNGGYRLGRMDFLINLDVNEEEIKALGFACKQLEGKDFIYSKQLDGLLTKIKVAKKYDYLDETDNYYVKENISSYLNEERELCREIYYAISSRQKIVLDYFSLSSGESRRIVHPYSIIHYKNSYYLVAYCEKRKMVIEFKISRIKNLTILEERFEIKEDFSLKEYTKDNIGIYKDGTYNLKLKIFEPMSYIISEKVWVDNQKVSWNDDNSIIFKAKMEGKTEIISWILSMGDKVKVIEPMELKDEINYKLNEMIKNFL